MEDDECHTNEKDTNSEKHFKIKLFQIFTL